MARGAISSHDPSAVLETVMKSAVKKTLATCSISRIPAANGSSGSDPLTYVPGPPTADPTENLRAFGFGVGLVLTDMLERG